MDCPGCVMQIRGGMDKDGAAIKVEHTAQRLADELESSALQLHVSSHFSWHLSGPPKLLVILSGA